MIGWSRVVPARRWQILPNDTAGSCHLLHSLLCYREEMIDEVASPLHGDVLAYYHNGESEVSSDDEMLQPGKDKWAGKNAYYNNVDSTRLRSTRWMLPDAVKCPSP